MSAAFPSTSTHRYIAAVQRAEEYLRGRVTESVTLDELSGLTGVSKFFLLRAFQREYGLSPREYQMQLRLAQARTLIAGGLPLSRVAHDAGFADQSHLVRRFKGDLGMTPSEYARQVGL
jgi:AraC family chemosensory pili system transcriptional regulator ChpD